MTAVANALGIARPRLSATRNRPPPRPRGRPTLPDAKLVADIRLLVADLPTYGYRRVHALLRRQAEKSGTHSHGDAGCATITLIMTQPIIDE